MNFGMVEYLGLLFLIGGRQNSESSGGFIATAAVVVSSDASATWQATATTAPWPARYHHALCMVGVDEVGTVWMESI